MAKRTNEELVYSFENVSFTTSGISGDRDWCVSSIEIHLRENAIPEIMLHLDPAHTPSDPMVPATKTGLEDLAKWNAVVQKMAQNKDRAKLTFEVWRKGEKDQAVSLKDWIVTGGGLITQGGKFAFEVIIQHPLSACSLAGVTFGDLVMFQDVRTNQSTGTNIVEALVNSAKALAKGVVKQTTITDQATVNIDVTAIVQRAQQRLTAAAEVMSKSLVWNSKLYDAGTKNWSYEDWPLYTQLQGSNLKYASVVSRFLWGMKDVNLWEILAHTIVDDMSVSIIPTFWTVLQLVPTSPWMTPAVTIEDTDISNVRFPAYERSMVAGVYCPSSFPCGGLNYDHTQNPELSMKYSTKAVLFTPNDPNIEGLILNMNVPQWFQGVMSGDSSESQLYTNVEQAEEDGRTGTAANVVWGQNVDTTDAAALASTLPKYAKGTYQCANQMFLTQFRSGSQASITTRLLLTYTGSTTMDGYVVPGYVCRVRSGETAIMDFYMTEIIHRIDFESGSADTTIAGKYVRPPEGFPNVAEPNTPNPMWKQAQGTT